jgi:uncharacterized protein (TIGR02147 family)
MNSPSDHVDYRIILRAALEAKALKNPAFSLRAFSKAVGLSPSHLSRVLNGKKNLSVTAAEQISKSLGHTRIERARFDSLVRLSLTSDSSRRLEILEKLNPRQPKATTVIKAEKFNIISDWIHFAILTMCQSRAFKSEPAWIAKRLGAKTSDVELALTRLLATGLLERTKSGALKPSGEIDLSTTDDVVSLAIQNNHQQQMERAKSALLTQQVLMREFDNIAVMMNLQQVAKAKKMIREFVSAFNDEMDSPDGTDLFQLNLQFFMSSLPEVEPK